MRKVFLTLLSFILILNLSAQVKSDFILKNRTNYTDLYMVMPDDAVKWKIATTEIKTFERPGFYLFDQALHQFIAIPNTSITSNSLKSEEKQKALLLGYMKYETDYFKTEIFKTNKLKTNYEFITINNRLYLFWSYEMPKHSKNINLQCYMNTLVPGKVIGINIPMPSAKDLEQGKSMLMEISQTMEYYPNGVNAASEGE